MSEPQDTQQIFLDEIKRWFRGNISQNKITQPAVTTSKIKFREIFSDNITLIIVLVLLSIIPYLNSLSNAFVSDDVFSIVQNPNVFNFGWVLSSKSLATFLLYLNYLVGGVNPLIYHLTNIFLHILVTVLVYLFIFYLTNKFVAFFAASVFAVHPIHTEAITWISGRPYALATLFILLSLLLYIAATQSKILKIKTYLLSLLSMFLGLFGTWIGLTFVPILFLYEICFGNIFKRLKLFLPYIGLTIFFLLTVYFSVFQSRIASLNPTQPSSPAFTNPLLQIPTAFTNYTKLLVWPANLSLYQEGFRYTFFEYFAMGIGVLAVLVVLPFIWRISKIAVFAILILPVSILPTLLPIFISWVVAERYIYFGSLGFSLLLGLVFWQLYKREKLKYLGLVLFILLITAYSVRTFIRNFDWKDADTLWVATVKASPLSPKAHNNMGDYYGRRGDLQASLREFETAITLKPDYADAYHNLGNTYLQLNDATRAAELFFKALSYNPNIPQTHNAIAVLYFNSGQIDKAREHWQTALTLDPNLEQAKEGLLLLEKK